MENPNIGQIRPIENRKAIKYSFQNMCFSAEIPKTLKHSSTIPVNDSIFAFQAEWNVHLLVHCAAINSEMWNLAITH